MALLYRRPGVEFGYLASRLGLSPMAVTVIGLCLAISLPLQAALLPLWLAPWAVALCGMLFQALDCADGVLARATGQSSRRGGDVDFLVDMAQWGFLYLALGVLADRAAETGHFWALTGAAAAWLRLMARMVRDRLAWMSSGAGNGPKTALDRLSQFLGGISGLIPLFAFLGPWAVAALLVYALLDVIEGALPVLR